jgi:hypothetical protein
LLIIFTVISTSIAFSLADVGVGVSPPSKLLDASDEPGRFPPPLLNGGNRYGNHSLSGTASASVSGVARASTSFCTGTDDAFGCGRPFQPHSPLVKCSFLPLEFLDCEEPEDLNGNQTRREELGHGCVKFGGHR